MKGPNPFYQWGREKEFEGRKTEMEDFRAALAQLTAGKSFAILLRGFPGSGKSALLRHMQHESEHNRFFAPVTGVSEGEKTDSLLNKIKAEMINYAGEKVGEGLINERTGANLRKLEKSEFPFSFARALSRSTEGIVIIIDDADGLKDPEKLGEFVAVSLRKAEREKIKLGFVVTSTKSISSLERPAKTMRLPPLQEHDIRNLIGLALKKGPPKMGEECIKSIMEDSEGSPKIAKEMCRIIFDKLPDKEKIITKGHYLAYSPAIMSALGRDFFDRLYSKLPRSEREVLRAFAEVGKPANISDIARKIKKRHATTLALRLAERGQLERVDRGLYRVFNRLYGRYAMERG